MRDTTILPLSSALTPKRYESGISETLPSSFPRRPATARAELSVPLTLSQAVFRAAVSKCLELLMFREERDARMLWG